MNAFIQSLNRLLTSLYALLHNRLSLASVELEEEALRLFYMLVQALLALFCGTFAMMLTVGLVLLLAWDTHPVATLLFFIACFAGGALWLYRGLVRQYRSKPPFLADTLAEIGKDIAALKDIPEKD
jgi:uncharacterized membrane protein YqjE